MVSTTRLRMALETEEERRAKKKDLGLLWIQIGKNNQGMSSLAL